MFQNITEEVHEEKENKNWQFKNIIKELLSLQNLIIYILTFLMSTLSIKQEIIPFGLAMVAACIGSTIPIMGVYAAALIGTYVGNGISALANFVAVSIIYMGFVLIFKSKVAVDERNEVIQTGGKLFLACLIVELIKNIKGIFLMYDLFIGIIASALVYIFYKIFVNGIYVIKNFGIKEAFSLEEVIASTILIAVASLAFPTQITHILIILMIMILGWKNGMLVGATSGIAIGLVVSFSNDASFIEIIMYAVSGIFSGFLNKFGKIGVICGFILGNAILTYVTNGNTLVISYFREIFIASIALLFVPNRIPVTIEDLMGNQKLLSNTGEKRLNEADVAISNKLKTVSDMFYEMMNAKETKVEKLKETFIQDFLDNLEEINSNIFYEEISHEENGIAADIYHCIEKNEMIVDHDFITILTNHNHYIFMEDETIKNDLQEIIKIANRTYKMLQIEIAKEQERNKHIKAMSNNLKEVTKVIDACAEKIVDASINPYEKKEKEIELLFKSKKMEIQNCFIRKLKNGKTMVTLEIPNTNTKIKEKETVNNWENLLSKSLGTRVTLLREKVKDKESFLQVYASEDQYVMQVASSKLTKEGSAISGDCNLQMKLDDGKYLLAIADGMGTGKTARESSKFVIKMIKELIASGFEKEESIQLLNSSLHMSTQSETYSSLDVMVLDLFTGQAEIMKSGACNTYIKNKKTIQKITSESLPVGITEKIDLKSQTINVAEGNLIVMCSDGVLDSKENTSKDWIEEFLKNVTTNNVQKLADLLLAEAIDNCYGNAQDDMTVIVCKIIKKNK